MICEDAKNALIEYRHRDLDHDSTIAVAAHLSECASCALDYCRLDADLLLLQAEPRAEVHAALKAKVAQEFAPKAWKKLLWPIPVAAAAAIVFWLIFNPKPEEKVVVENYDASAILAVDPDLL